MANEKKMDQLLLGLLSHEPLSGYEIKKRIDTGVSLFWSASYGSIYPTLRELEARGFVTKKQIADTGRNKHSYTITDGGRQHLLDWLSISGSKDELRYETLLKIFFCGEACDDTALKHIHEFAEKSERMLSILQFYYENLENLQDEPAHRYYILTVKFGIKTYQAYLEWCKEAVEQLEGMKD